MQTCSVRTYEVDLDIARYVRRHMERLGCEEQIVDGGKTFITARAESDEELANFCVAICEFIVRDLAQIILADIIKNIPVSVEERKEILTEAIGYSRKAVLRTTVKKALYEFFSSESNLVIEGFINFRMDETRRIWERCVDCAAENLLLRNEQEELACLLGSIACLTADGSSRVSLIVNDDGTCSITDGDSLKIDYPNGDENSVLNMLISLCPTEIVVYDLTNGRHDGFLSALCRVFSGRISVYRTITE